jgi:hypothetical protein
VKFLSEIVLGVLLTAGVVTVSAQPERIRHPRIPKAIEALEDARAYMREAAHDFGGHRVEAMRHRRSHQATAAGDRLPRGRRPRAPPVDSAFEILDPGFVIVQGAVVHRSDIGQPFNSVFDVGSVAGHFLLEVLVHV